MAEYVSVLPFIGPYHQEVGLGLVVLIITYFSLVIGELVPKRLAMRHPESIATWVAVPLALVCLAIGADGALTQRLNRSGLPPFRSERNRRSRR